MGCLRSGGDPGRLHSGAENSPGQNPWAFHSCHQPLRHPFPYYATSLLRSWKYFLLKSKLDFQPLSKEILMHSPCWAFPSFFTLLYWLYFLFGFQFPLWSEGTPSVGYRKRIQIFRIWASFLHSIKEVQLVSMHGKELILKTISN